MCIRDSPYTDVPAFMVRLREHPGNSARALELTILTAARTNETIGSMRDEFDSNVSKLWTVPAVRMKGKNPKTHRVPLSPRAIEIVESMKHNERFLFPGAKLN